MPAVTGLNHITFSVSDLARSFSFYVDVLGCRPLARWSKRAYLSAGGTWLALIENAAVVENVRGDYSHIAFTCQAEEFVELSDAIEKHGGEAWSENRSEGDSYYFSDPDGHRLEIHVGDLTSRLVSMRNSPWDEFEFFD